MNQTLIDFYLGTAPDTKGRYFKEIIAWRDDKLESQHDYIQHLFPLQMESRFNPSALLLDDETIEFFRNDYRIWDNVTIAFNRMMSFYNFDFDNPHPVWCSNNNHNYLRLTRMLTFLNLIRMEQLADRLWINLQDLYQNNKEAVGAVTYSFWKNAADAI